MDSFVFGHLGNLLYGLQISLLLLAAVTIVGGIVGAVMAYGHLSQMWLLGVLATVVDIALRGLPTVVLLLVIYYGVSDAFTLASFWAATLALGLRAGGYFGRIFEGAVLAVPATQTLAAYSIGLSKLGAFFHVVLPQAYKHALPGVANEISAQLKLTSLAFVVGVVELMRQARYIISTGKGSLLGILIVTAMIYYIANSAILSIFKYLERRGDISANRPVKLLRVSYDKRDIARP